MTTKTARQPSNDRINGFDTQALTQVVGALTQDRSLAKFEFRARNQWIDGGENRSTIQGFYGAGSEDRSRIRPFTVTNDEPPLLLGNNAGANPGEFVLHALAGCVTTTTVMHAAARGINVRSISTELTGDIDLQGLLDLDPAVRPGYQGIKVKMHIQADCSDEALDELLAFVHSHSPVCDTLMRPVPVTLERVRHG
jgi:uncharacterized OsmC-like protein